MTKFTRYGFAVLLAGSLVGAPAAQAGPWSGGGYRGGFERHHGYGRHNAYRRHEHRRGRNVAGAIAAGAALGLIGAAIAASRAKEAQRERDAAAWRYGY